jgi:hypothetical protein
VKELIVIRSLTDSDLGIFAAHRETATSKQRAININAAVAKRILSTTLFRKGGATFQCRYEYDGTVNESKRSLIKVHKNWRLGGAKLEGDRFADIDSKDFVLIRSVAGNDGSAPIFVRFVSRKADRVLHAGLVAIVEKTLIRSMVAFVEGTAGFDELARLFSRPTDSVEGGEKPQSESNPVTSSGVKRNGFPPMPPRNSARPSKVPTLREKMRSGVMFERMLKAAGDLSAPAQLKFFETIELLAGQLRELLMRSGRIAKLKKEHKTFWPSVRGKTFGFVDGGLANLSMIGTAPIAARVGGYIVKPGERGPHRERFEMVRHLIGELYSEPEPGIYTGQYPDMGALRDAARISIESAGALHILSLEPNMSCLLVHGALVNPVSRYTDVMKDEKVVIPFPDFTSGAVRELLPTPPSEEIMRPNNFISVHYKQLSALANSQTAVCGIVEREGTSSAVITRLVDTIEDQILRDALPEPPDQYRAWFKRIIDPSFNDDFEGGRITDSLLLRCVLEPGEVLIPVDINRNEMRRAPDAWKAVIKNYPRPYVAYLLPTVWSPPIRIEVFEKDLPRFKEIASLVLHCSALMPNYSFPVGLDIVDKFVKVPNWMSRPVNTFTAVSALKTALDSGNTKLFDALRYTLCGSKREWYLRPTHQ